MIDLRRFSSPLPVCAALDALEISVGDIMKRLGLSVELWSLWRNGKRRPSAKALWGLTLLAHEALSELSEVEKNAQSMMSEAARCQMEILLQYVRSLLSLQATINLALSPAAKAAAKAQMQRPICQFVLTA
jgi:transcriptional regulator with XRE-family HTH domain